MSGLTARAVCQMPTDMQLVQAKFVWSADAIAPFWLVEPASGNATSSQAASAERKDHFAKVDLLLDVTGRRG